MAEAGAQPTTPLVDQSTEFGSRVAHHLEADLVVWLTTVSPGGAPQPSPVWFLWDGARTVRLFSLPDTSRARNIASNSKVSLNFPGDAEGGDIVVISGIAEAHAERGDWVRQHLDKYADAIVRIGSTPESFQAAYSLPIAVTLTGVRGH